MSTVTKETRLSVFEDSGLSRLHDNAEELFEAAVAVRTAMTVEERSKTNNDLDTIIQKIKTP